jgi:hypothetical protein
LKFTAVEKWGQAEMEVDPICDPEKLRVEKVLKGRSECEYLYL